MSLKVKAVNAVLTHDTEFFSNMDPYCVLTLGRQKHRTRTKNQAGKRPIWNESFTFTASDNILKVTVMDEDTITDDVVGEGTVDLARFRNNSTEQQQFVQLYYKGKTAGRVQLMISGGGGNMGQGGMGQGQNSWGQNQGYNPNMGGQGYNQNMGQQGYGGQLPYGANRGGMGALMNGPPGYQQPPPMPMMQQPQNNNTQWGDLNQNNGWGNFNPGGFTNNPPPNPYPNLDSPHQANPLQMLGQAFGGGQGGMGAQGSMGGMGGMGGVGVQGGNKLQNPSEQYNLINGMAMLGQNQNNNPYGGGNPYA